MQLDLNLLRPLHALLQEQSVTRAAAALGLSQPACSAALGRLRRHFDDPLLVRVRGRGTQLTPLARRLRGTVAALMNDIDAVAGASSSFDPATSDREFTILVSDAEAEVIAPALIQRLRLEAPHARLRLEAPSSAMQPTLREQLSRHDLVVLPEPALPEGVPTLTLYEERWAYVVSLDDDLREPVDPAYLARRSWAACYDIINAPWSPARLIERSGMEEILVVRTDSFLQLFAVVESGGLTALVPARLAIKRCAANATRWVPVPEQIAPSFRICAAWSPLHTLDPAHRWLRELVASVVA
ncbi:LysR family transcriptional regulator [Microbacterium sp. SORGH_AS_0862]|uniref:LysR family transcriptional regulator n=1 Tax=Microbacterium sp. SORGH_AS_0862 TaxID=3041789 RepID=UPI00278E4D3C|nr:LysR family transcriptional regulator [Microbacterium sp. SORGH_AS_0862]MDQ1206265.1 DNA-binding transcriptional LysR family regulator [Microbacterium sp. SORGH_AS_0862]